MNIKQFLQNCNRWQRTSGILAILFILYTLFGFFILPPIIKNQITNNIHKATNRNVTLKKVRFNPLILSLTIQNFKIDGKRGEKFVGWQEFYVNFQLSTIFRFAWTFDEIRLIKPCIFIEKITADTFNFSDLLPDKSTEADGAENAAVKGKDEDNKIPPVRINKLVFDGGRLHFRDSSRGRSADFLLDSVSFMLEKFKTRLQPGQDNTYNFRAYGPKGGFLHWNGTFRLAPLESKGSIELSGIYLPSFVSFYKDELQFAMPKGIFSFSTRYHVFEQPDWGIELSQGDYTFSDLLITEKETENSLFELPLFSINNVALSLNDQKISVEAITIKDARLIPSVSESGEINLLKALDMSALTSGVEPAKHKTDTDKPDEPDGNWYWEVKQFNIDDFCINFTDQTPTTPFSYTVMPVNIQVSDIVSDGHIPFTLSFSGIFNKKGRITASGTGTVAPASVVLDINKKGLLLKDFQPYIDRYAYITMLDGTTGSSMHVEVDINKKGELTKLQAAGNAYINNLNIQDNFAKKDLLKWKKYAIEGIMMDAVAGNVTINKITMSEPGLNFQINEDMTTNIQHLIVLSEESESEPPAKASDKTEIPFKVSINEIIIKNGSVGFADLSLKPNFVTKIEQLNGRITAPSNIPGKTATVDLKGKVGRHTPVFIKGNSNLLADPQFADITVSFKNVDMSSFTSYSGTYAGYKIDKGQLSVDLKYLLNATELQGDNKIVIHKLEFGDKVESDKAVNLPLKLAVALLSDVNGVIDLDFVVKGDLDDPEFNIGSITWKVLKNIIVKTVRSPFKLLAGLAGGGENLDVVAFSPGSDRIEGIESKKVVQLAGALAKRPRLSLNIRGQVAYESDLHTLKQMHLDHLLTTTSEINAAEIGGILAAAQKRKWRNTLFDLYKKTFDESWRDVRTRLSKKAKAQGEKIDKDTLFNKSVETIYNALIDKQAVTEENLHVLADNRSQNIKVELVENHGIDPGRIFIMESNVSTEFDNSAAILTLDTL